MSSDLDYGLSKNVETVQSPNERTNPFYIDIDGSVITKMDDRELFTTYNRVLILCQKNNVKSNVINTLMKKKISLKGYKKCGKVQIGIS